jgi:hypothetical protein
VCPIVATGKTNYQPATKVVIISDLSKKKGEKITFLHQKGAFH